MNISTGVIQIVGIPTIATSHHKWLNCYTTSNKPPDLYSTISPLQPRDDAAASKPTDRLRRYELIEDDLKTPTSRRTIDLDERTVAVMRRHRRQQVEDQLANGVRSNDGYVFARGDGAPIHPDFMRQAFERLITQSPLSRIRLRDLRHTHATIMLKEGVPVKVVSERLGHASAALTMTVYQHILPGMQAEAAATFANTVFGDADLIRHKI